MSYFSCRKPSAYIISSVQFSSLDRLGRRGDTSGCCRAHIFSCSLLVFWAQSTARGYIRAVSAAEVKFSVQSAHFRLQKYNFHCRMHIFSCRSIVFTAECTCSAAKVLTTECTFSAAKRVCSCKRRLQFAATFCGSRQLAAGTASDNPRGLVSWCFELSQPQRIISGLKTNSTLSPSCSSCKS